MMSLPTASSMMGRWARSSAVAGSASRAPALSRAGCLHLPRSEPAMVTCLQVRFFSRKSEDGPRRRRGPTAADLVGQLDPIRPADEAAASGGQALRSMGFAKLHKPLVSGDKPVLDQASQGALEATAEEIRDHINELLCSPKFYKVFRGVADASELVEVAEVRCSKDYATTAYWHTPSMGPFLRVVADSMGEREAGRLSGRIASSVQKTLEAKEGLFRSYLMKKMDFKKVPKIGFRALAEIQQKERGDKGKLGNRGGVRREEEMEDEMEEDEDDEEEGGEERGRHR
ncbi:hypothetical protein B484DRAFT_453578 [Ochromonadaceae sp. CCMP2298]|nr:hypothetical protein B484DRAFT_453578 [Ochromonadaceae sp. CCMP2298]